MMQEVNISAPEFRLYYDNDGNVICYSGEKAELPYNFIVIDAISFAECRFDVKVKDGKIVKNNTVIYSKYVLNQEGISCSKEDICIIVANDSNCNKWRLITNEL